MGIIENKLLTLDYEIEYQMRGNLKSRNNEWGSTVYYEVIFQL